MNKNFSKNKMKILSLLTEIPLPVAANDEKIFSSRLAARQFYNACWAKAKGRLKLAKQLTLYQNTKKIKSDIKERKTALCAAEEYCNCKNYYSGIFNLISYDLIDKYLEGNPSNVKLTNWAFKASVKFDFSIAKKLKQQNQLNFLAENRQPAVETKLVNNRKFIQGKLVHEILSLGNKIKLENVQMEQRVDSLAVKFDLCSTVAELYDHDGYK